jgi:poly(3-hydroxybutyrate) depolymerase
MKTVLSVCMLLALAATGFAQGAGDWGDAPHCYPVTAAPNGARHIVSALQLGGSKNYEPNGQPHPTAQHPNEEPTDDGIELPAQLAAGQMAGIRVFPNAGARLDAWIDWNHDGDWSDPGEQIFASQPVVAGLNDLNFAVPSAAIGGTSIARFRLSTPGGLVPTGIASDGEVEDWTVQIAAVAPPPPQFTTNPADALSFTVNGTAGDINAIWTFVWRGTPGVSTIIQSSHDLVTWSSLARPAGAPVAPGIQSYVLDPHSATGLIGAPNFFRILRKQNEPDSPVPCFAGIHRDLRFLHGGLTRTHTLIIPPSYVPGQVLPLVLVLHGKGQSATEFVARNGIGLANAAAAQNMILCFPDATESAGGSTGWESEDDDGDLLTPWVDDVGFLDALSTALEGALGANPARRYITGFSSGGRMTNFAAARTTKLLGAVAPLAGTVGNSGAIGGPLIINPPLANPLPALMINLVDDGTRLFMGLDTFENKVASVARGVEYWVDENNLGSAPPQANGLPAVPPVQTQVLFNRPLGAPGFSQYNVIVPPLFVRAAYPHTMAGQQVTQTSITTETWQFPVGITTNEFILVVLSDGGHQWPGASDQLGYDASTEVLAFFARH